MELTDATHDFACVRCGATDGVCMEALWLARRIAGEISARADSLPADFEVTADSRFLGCDRDCAVRLRITAAAVEVASGSHGARVEASLRRRPVRALASGG